MKKILIATVAMLGVASYSYGQGEVFFSAGSSAATRIQTNSVPGAQSSDQTGTGSAGGAVGTWTFALFFAPSTVTTVGGNTPWTDVNWTFSGVYGTNGAVGRFSGLTPGNANLAAVITPGYAAGSTASLQAIGWNTAVGGATLASFISAYQASNPLLYYGYSHIAQPQLGNGAAVPDVSMFGAGQGQVSGFTLAPIVAVPEPATFAMAGLGAAALLIVRRRK